jgi:hypothetical protein
MTFWQHFVNHFFEVLPLSACDLSIAVGAGALVLVAMEVEKAINNRKSLLR